MAGQPLFIFVEKSEEATPILANASFVFTLVGIFIRRIELFDDHMTIYFNASDGQITSIPIDESEKVRLWGDVVDPKGIEPSTS